MSVIVTTFVGTNGAYSSSNNTLGLKWSIISGNDLLYFTLNETTGELSMNNTIAPVGNYPLTIRLQDAVNSVGSPLIGADPYQTFNTDHNITVILTS